MTGGVLLPAWAEKQTDTGPPTGTDPFAGGALWRRYCVVAPPAHLLHRYAFEVSGHGWAEGAKARAARVKVREIEAHRWAIDLQETAAVIFDRVGQSRKSRNARRRAEHAREMLRLALVQQKEAEGGI
jgi:hypothetical protein